MALVDKVIFLDEKLKQLQVDIDTNGLNVEMCQGAYSIMRANPSCATYTSFVKNYNTLMKLLFDILPKDTGMADDEIDEKYF